MHFTDTCQGVHFGGGHGRDVADNVGEVGIRIKSPAAGAGGDGVEDGEWFSVQTLFMTVSGWIADREIVITAAVGDHSKCTTSTGKTAPEMALPVCLAGGMFNILEVSQQQAIQTLIYLRDRRLLLPAAFNL